LVCVYRLLTQGDVSVAVGNTFAWTNGLAMPSDRIFSGGVSLSVSGTASCRTAPQSRCLYITERHGNGV